MQWREKFAAAVQKAIEALALLASLSASMASYGVRLACEVGLTKSRRDSFILTILHTAEAVLQGGGPILTIFSTQLNAVCKCHEEPRPTLMPCMWVRESSCAPKTSGQAPWTVASCSDALLVKQVRICSHAVDTPSQVSMHPPLTGLEGRTLGGTKGHNV